MLPGVAILTRRADALAMSLASTELASVRADSTQRQFVLDVAFDESFLVARLDDSQRVEAAGFEKAKAGLDGLHFVVVQRPDDDGVEPAGFWLLREMSRHKFMDSVLSCHWQMRLAARMRIHRRSRCAQRARRPMITTQFLRGTAQGGGGRHGPLPVCTSNSTMFTLPNGGGAEYGAST